MRILLIESGVMAPENFVYQCYPPHGLMYLASYLRQKDPEHELRILDLMEKRARPEEAAPIIKEFQPHFVAIHAMSFQASSMHAVASLAKSILPGCVVGVGGPHPTAAAESVIEDPNIDVAAVGEGEDTFVELVRNIESGAGLCGTAGTVVKSGEEIVWGPSRPFIHDLDELPFPAWDLLDLSRYFTDVMLNQNDITCRREVSTIFTSRACPFGCIFCHNMFGKRFRGRSAQNVLDELTALQREHGIREVHVIDDCFNCDRGRAEEIMQGVLDRGLDLKFAFPNGIRGDRLPDTLLDLMREAGTYKINFGIESGSPRVQKLIKKGLNLESLRDAVERAANIGIFTHGFFMLGFPGETRDEMEQTISFACSSQLHTAGFALLSPFPGTEVHAMAAESGKKVEYDPDDTSYARVSTNLTAEDDETLYRMHKKAHRRFYTSPRRICRIISAMPRPADFFRVGLKHFRLKFL